MTLRDSYVQKLEAENEELRAHIGRLEDLLGMRLDAPLEFGLTPTEARLFGLLTRVEMATKDRIMFALYASRIDAEPEIKIVDVLVHHIRKKVEPFGITIETLWGTGYRMPPEAKARAGEFCAKPASEAVE